MRIKEILVLHHSHMDIGYTHPQRLVWELHRRCIDEAIDLCEQTAGYPEGSQVKWTCEVTNVVFHSLKARPRRRKSLAKACPSTPIMDCIAGSVWRFPGRKMLRRTAFVFRCDFDLVGN